MDNYTKFLEEGIDRLALSERAYNMLKRSGIVSVGQLLEAKKRGLNQIKGLGKKSISIINKALDLSKIEHGLSDETDNRPFAHPLHIIHNEPPNILSILINITDHILKYEKDDRLAEIMHRRNGFKGDRYYTLEDLGEYYDLTRERIRQLEGESIKLIRNAITGKKRSLDWKIHSNIITESNKVYYDLKELNSLLTEIEIKNYFENRYKLQRNAYEKEIYYLLSLFGFEKVAISNFSPSIKISSCWKISEELDISLLNEVVEFIRDFLRDEIIPVSLFDLKIALNKGRTDRVHYKYLEHALKICNEIEYSSTNHYTIKFEYLPTIVDKAYRVLNDVGKPMHYRDILREINYRLVNAGLKGNVTQQSLRGELGNDDRCLPIGKSGKWFIKEWDHIDNITIGESIEEYFHMTGKMATVDEIYTHVKIKRPDVPKSSVLTILQIMKDKFIRVSKTEYELKVWGGKEINPQDFSRKKYDREDFYNYSKDFFQNRPSNTATYKSLYEFLKSKISMSNSTYYLWVDQAPFLSRIKTSDANEKQIKFEDVDKGLLLPFYGKSRTKKGENIKRVIERYLSEQPDKRDLIRNVRNHILGKKLCGKPAFYKYLSEMENVDKEVIENKHYCYLVIEEEQRNSIISGFSDIVEEVNDPSLKKELKRTIGKFNPDEIELAMFNLGKIFENVAKDFLITANKQNVFAVSNRDLSSLSSMLRSIEENGIITKSHHLALLREVRNQRAHEILDEKGRQKLLQHAPFIGELFLTYIKILHEKKLDIALI